jgi:thiosulfate/3-mercaptopyruvate sulfurtransferase
MDAMRPLIDTAALAELLDSGRSPVLLDVRWRLGGPPGRPEYERGHLPGAVYVDLDTELAAPHETVGPDGRHPPPAPADLQRTLRAAGVRADRPVVVYDAADGSVAARAWWLLRWAGHRDVAVLDGGFAAWSARDLPVSTGEPDPAEGDFEVRPGAMPTLDADTAAGLARDGMLLDARAAERYAGESEPVDRRAGHIPGARNAPFAGHTGEDGGWLPADQLAGRFRELGVDPAAPVGAYCGSGVTACSVVLALEHAGLTDQDNPAALYPGSWSGWSAQPDRPAATGGLPG